MRRYSSRQGLTFGEGDKGVRRLQLVIIIVLAVALTVSLVMLIPNLSARPEIVNSCIYQIKDEWKNANSEANLLSSTGSASSNNKPLASILSHVRVIRALNDVYAQAGGKAPLDTALFDTLNASINAYLATLTTSGGTLTNEYNIQIQDGLNALWEQIDAM